MERLTLKQAYDLLLARVSRIEEWEEIPLGRRRKGSCRGDDCGKGPASIFAVPS